MSFQPWTIVFTLSGGLLLAGILGWIRKARLIVFVPRLFSHSKISDKGQIAEISIMNRGFGTEEAVELVLTPSMHYELVGANDPDAVLIANKLTIPRIGSADDCSVLLQVENGKFSHTDIVKCLSKSTKASTATKLEEVPATAQQRVAILLVFGLLTTIFIAGMKGIDYYFERDKKALEQELAEIQKKKEDIDLQGWTIADHYVDEKNTLYVSLAAKEIQVATGRLDVSKRIMRVPFTLKNSSSRAITLHASISASLDQDSLPLAKRRVFDKLVLPGDTFSTGLEAIVPTEASRRTAIVEFFLSEPEGETLKGTKLLQVQER